MNGENSLIFIKQQDIYGFLVKGDSIMPELSNIF